MKERIKNIFSSHPNYFIGFTVWLCAIISLILFPKLDLFKIKCSGCSEYSRFISMLSVEQKSKLDLFEAGILDVGGKLYFISDTSDTEFNLFKQNKIFYNEYDLTMDEITKRLIIVNSVIKSMSPFQRDLILNKKAIVLYRKNRCIMIGDKNEQKTTNK